MDMYENKVFANLWAYEMAASHALFAENYPEDLRATEVESSRHAKWLFDLELRFSTCPFDVSNTKKLLKVI